MQEEKSLMRKIFRRVYWENLSTILILIGVFMLLQPFAMWMFTYSFIVILSLAVWLLKGFMDEIPKEYEEAAMIDGYSRLQAFFKAVSYTHLTLPTSDLV